MTNYFTNHRMKQENRFQKHSACFFVWKINFNSPIFAIFERAEVVESNRHEKSNTNHPLVYTHQLLITHS